VLVSYYCDKDRCTRGRKAIRLQQLLLAPTQKLTLAILKQDMKKTRQRALQYTNILEMRLVQVFRFKQTSLLEVSREGALGSAYEAARTPVITLVAFKVLTPSTLLSLSTVPNRKYLLPGPQFHKRGKMLVRPMFLHTLTASA
jgi:hypothetical protein